MGCNAFSVGELVGTVSQGGRSSPAGADRQPWADGFESRWDLRTERGLRKFLGGKARNLGDDAINARLELTSKNVHPASIAPARADSRPCLYTGGSGDGADIHEPV